MALRHGPRPHYPPPAAAAHIQVTVRAFMRSYSAQLRTPQSWTALSPAHIIKNLTSEKHGERVSSGTQLNSKEIKLRDSLPAFR